MHQYLQNKAKDVETVKGLLLLLLWWWWWWWWW
jgi:hypothetical protein